MCTQAHVEQMFKGVDLVLCVQAMEVYTVDFAKIGLERIGKVFELGTDDALDGTPYCGLSGQLFADLACVLAMSRVGRAMVSKKKLQKDDRMLACIVSRHVAILSPSIRCYHKSLVATNLPTKEIWTEITRITSEADNAIEISDETVQAWVSDLAAGMDEDDPYGGSDVLVEILNKDGSTLEAYSQQQTSINDAKVTDNDDESDGVQLRLNIGALLDKTLKGHAYHAEVLNDHCKSAPLEIKERQEEGTDEVIQQVKDAVFYSENNNMPNDVAAMQVSLTVARLLSGFDTNCEGLFRETAARGDIHVSFWKAVNMEIGVGFNECDRFKMMMDCYRQAVWLGAPAASETRIADEDSTFYEVQTFND